VARPKTRAEQKDATRARLLDVARRVFMKHGYDETSIALVCRSARVTHGALYHHFSSKDALFAAVLGDVFNEVGARVSGALFGRSGWAQVEAACAAYLDACTDPEVQLFVFRDGPRVLSRETFDAIDHAANAPLVEGLIARWIAQGVFEPRSIGLVARLLGAAFAEAGLAIQQAADTERQHVAARVSALLLAWVSTFRRSSFNGLTVIATERLMLEPWAPTDLAVLMDLTAQPNVYRYLFDGIAPTADWIGETIANSVQALERGDLGMWLARNGSGAVVGFAGFVPGDGATRELVVATHPNVARRGFAREMATAVLSEASARRCSRIGATADLANVASVRLLEALGFVKVGRCHGPLGEIDEYVLPIRGAEC
jgi:AcrR family transcriptional regulator